MAPRPTLPSAEEIGELVPITAIANQTPYSPDFLRQLARTGKIRAYKLHRDWLTTPAAVREYLKSQTKRHEKALSLLQAAEKAFLAAALLIIVFSATPQARAEGLSNPPPRAKSATSAILHDVQDAWRNVGGFVHSHLSPIPTRIKNAALALAHGFFGDPKDNLVLLTYPQNRESVRSEVADPIANQQVLSALATKIDQQPGPGQSLGMSASQIEALLNQTLQSYVASGKFTGPQGPKGDKGDSGLAQGFSGPNGSVQNDNGKTSAVIGGTPIVSYVPPVQSAGFSGTSLAGFGQLSAANFVTENATVSASLNVSGAASLASLTTSGNVSISGNLSAATSTVSTLTVSGAATFTGSTTIAGLTVTGLNPGLTPGSVTFQSASALSQDNAYFFYDSTNHRLGLGTTTPGQLLTVAGNFLVTGNATTTGIQIVSGALSVAGASSLATTTATSLTVSGAATLQSTLSVAATSTLAVVTATSLTTTGNVGIGTTTADSRLSVLSASTDVLRIGSIVANGNTFLFQTGVAASSSNFPTIGNNELVVSGSASGNNILALRNTDATGYSSLTARDSNGAEKLAVGYGNASVGADIFTSSAYIQAWGDTTPPLFQITQDGNYGPVGSGFRFYRRLSFDTSSNFDIWRLIPWGTAQKSSLNINANTGVATFASNAASDAVVIKNEATNGFSTAAFQDSSGNGRLYIGHANSSSASLVAGKSFLQTYNGGSIPQDFLIGTYTSQFNPTAVFSGSGNVGIGSTSPTAVLAVQGTSTNPTYPLFVVASSTGRQLLTVLPSGNVGINSTTPSTQLAVKGSGSIDPFDVSSSSNGSLLRVTTSGNVGIGTTTPSVKLEVNGGTGVALRIAGGGDLTIASQGSGSDTTLYNDTGTFNINTPTTIAGVLGVTGGIAAVGGSSKFTFSSTANSYGQLQLGNPSGKEASMAYVGNLTGFGSPPTSSSGDTFIWNTGVGLYSSLGSQYSLANKSYGGPSFLVDSAGGVAIGTYAGTAQTTAPPANGLIVSGNVGIGTTTPTLGPLTMASGAYVSSGGTWTNASDRNLKENFATMSPASILEKIIQLPITQWDYKSEGSTVNHIGPVAQDFWEAFHLGNSATSISTIDPAGVALLGIQALDQKIAALQGSFTGNVTSSVTLAVYIPGNFSGDSVGEAKILPGQTSVRISFDQPYTQQPIVTITAEDQSASGEFVTDRDASGFTIRVPNPVTSFQLFAWHSFASPEARLTVSDGATLPILLVLPAAPNPGGSVLDASVIPDSVSASSSPDSTASTTPGALGEPASTSTAESVAPTPPPESEPSQAAPTETDPLPASSETASPDPAP